MQDFYSTTLIPWLSSSLYSLYSGKSKISSSLWKSTGFPLSLDGIKIYIIPRKVYLIKLDMPTLGKIFREDSCYKMVPQGHSLPFSAKAAMVVMLSQGRKVYLIPQHLGRSLGRTVVIKWFPGETL